MDGRKEVQLANKKSQKNYLPLPDNISVVKTLLNIMKRRGAFYWMFLGKKYFFMRHRPKPMSTTLEATLGRKNSLSPTGTRVYVHLNLVGFCQIFPIFLFSSALFLYKNSLLLSIPQRGRNAWNQYISPRP